MRRYLTFLLASTALAVSATGQDSVASTPLGAADLDREPYLHNGLLYSGGAIGSASMVAEGVFSTAAHVVFDDDLLAWVPIQNIRYYPRHHQALQPGPAGDSFLPVALLRWEQAYPERVENDDSGPGLSSPDTFNIDFATGYFSALITDARLVRHSGLHVDLPEAVGVLREHRAKTIVGYPVQDGGIPAQQQGLMHATAPGDYFCWWGGLEQRPDTWFDSGGVWTATYDFEDVTTYSGNSGGPMYVQDDEDEWLMAGVLVGGGGGGSFVRGIDENAWHLIEQAALARDASPLRRVADLAAVTGSDGAVRLQWTDSSAQEAGWRVYRRDTGPWQLLASLPPDSAKFTDASVLPGHSYAYRVQPFRANGNRPPLSPAAAAAVPGASALASATLGQPWLRFSMAGDSNWLTDGGGRLRAGQVNPLGYSSLVLSLIGPGTLEFDWSVSSEENPDYNNPLSEEQGEIYDALFLHLNGEPVMAGDAPVFLSGFSGPLTRQLVLPAGPHTVEWQYEKDPYATEGEDTGYLDRLAWTPAAAGAHPVFGAFAYAEPGWSGSAWFGDHFTAHLPWAFHQGLGWLYLRPGDGLGLHFHAQAIGDLYTRPDLFPFLYDFGRRAWLYHYPGTGDYGRWAWFYDFAESRHFRLP